MSTIGERLFELDDFPEVPLFKEPRRRKGAQIEDERLDHDYPPEWKTCLTCDGSGVDARSSEFAVERGQASIAQSPGQGGNWAKVTHKRSGLVAEYDGFGSGLMNVNAAMAMLRPKLREAGYACPDCLGMGSVKARVRFEAGHRCVRCGHPYIPKGDAKMLGVEPTPHHWSPCDERCTHGGSLRWAFDPEWGWAEVARDDTTAAQLLSMNPGLTVEAEWRILTVHHLDGDKANLRWWNLASLCQRCHLYIQAKVVLERVYPHEHSEWFKPYAAGWYAYSYLCKTCGLERGAREANHRTGLGGDVNENGYYPHPFEPGLELSREVVESRLDELLALELAPT